MAEHFKSHVNAPMLPLQLDGVLRLPQVLQAIGVSRSTLYTMIRDGSFPAPLHLGARSRGWLKSEVTAWIASRVQSRAAA